MQVLSLRAGVVVHAATIAGLPGEISSGRTITTTGRSLYSAPCKGLQFFSQKIEPRRIRRCGFVLAIVPVFA